MEGRRAGWYADPVKVGGARYWDGRTWTPVVAWGGATKTDDTPLSVVAREEARADAVVVTAYLDDASSRGVVDVGVAEALQADVMARIATAAGPPDPATRAVPARPVPTGTAPAGAVPMGTVPTGVPVGAAPRPVAATLPPPPPVPVPGPVRPAAVPIRPGRVSAWWDDVRHAVRSDLALHGLAYLGVLLLFAGVTGLIVFSFGDVAPWVRALAEFLLPTALVVSARYLGRRGADVVAVSLTVLGGAITPIVVAASLTDGAPIPPDLSGTALAIGQGLAVAAVAAVMALLVYRSPRSGLRFTAGPTLWLAAGLAAAAWRDVVPTGYAVARPDSFQLAILLTLMAVTVGACGWHRIPPTLALGTQQVALPVAAGVAVIELVLAGYEGWPVAGAVLAGLAVITVLETAGPRLLGRRLGPAVALGQLAVASLTAGRLAVRLDGHWVALGGAVALLALTEYNGRRRPSPAVGIVGLSLVGAALSLTLGATAPAALGFGLLALWGLARHIEPPAWLPVRDDAGIVAASGTLVTTIVLWQRSPLGPAMIVTAAAVLALAGAGRLWRPARQDLLWRWFTPAAAATVTLVTPAGWWDSPVEAAVAAGLATLAFGLTTLPRGVRTWVCAGGTVWVLADVAHAAGLSAGTQAAVLAAAALALVVGAVLVARGICGHLVTIGLVTGLGAFAAVPGRGWVATWVAAAATLGWLTVTVVDERTEAVHLAALRRIVGTSGVSGSAGVSGGTTGPDLVRLVADMGPLVCLAGLGLSVLLAGDAGGWVGLTDAWSTVPAAAVAVTGAAAARLVPWRRARRIVPAVTSVTAAGTIALLAMADVGGNRDHWAPVVCLALALAAFGVMPAPRPAVFRWAAWADLATLVAYVLDRVGLDRDRADLGVAAWGAVVLVGALALNRLRHGPVPTGSAPQDRLLLPPIVTGALGFVGGGAVALVDPDPDVIGWTALGLAAVFTVVALLLPLGILVAVAELFATAAYGLLAPWDTMQQAWTFAPWTVGLLLVAWATRRPGRSRLARWDLPSFVVAHGVALLALQFAMADGRVTPTFLAFALTSLGVAAVLRRWPWAAAAGLLLLGAAGDAGRGWLALVLVVEGVILNVVARRATRAPLPAFLAGLGSLCVTGSWFALADWQSWSIRTTHLATVPVALTAGLAAAVALRTGRGPRALTGVWTATAHATALMMAVAGPADLGRRHAGLELAAALAVTAVTTAVLVPLLGPRARWLTAALAATATIPAAWGLELSDTVATLAGTGTALVLLGAVLAVGGPRPGAGWLHPGAGAAVALQILATGTALHQLPDHSMLIVVLLAVAAECIALAVVTRLPYLHVLAPAAACAAWLVHAADALRGDANWFTVPVGLTLLVMVGLVRWIRRGRGGNPTADELVGLELVGMSVLVGPALARTLVGHLWHGALAVGIGIGLAVWGITTQVRWRAAFGAGAIGLATALLIGVPLSGAITWRGPALWITLSVVGMAAIGMAAAIERSRNGLRKLARRLDEMTAGWEGVHHPRGTDDHHPGGTTGTTGTSGTAPPLAPT